MPGKVNSAVNVMAEGIASVSDEFGLSLDQAQAALSALDAAGYAVVPKEPTKAMLRAIAHLDWTSKDDLSWADGYRAMLSASQVKI